MINSTNSKRLDNIELKLTPKQWAIRLADEMRRYASEEDLKAIAKGTYRQSPYIKPFYALCVLWRVRESTSGVGTFSADLNTWRIRIFWV